MVNTMKRNEYSVRYNAYTLSINVLLLAMLAFVVALISGFWAEDFIQSTGYPRSILSHNRDWIVNGRGWFLIGLLVCLMMLYQSLISRSKLQKAK